MKLLPTILLVILQLLYSSYSKSQIIIDSPSVYQTTQIISFPSRYRMVFKDSLTLVSRDSKYGIIDSTGQEVVPSIYDEIDVDFFLRGAILRQLRYSNEYFYNYWGDGNESEEEYK